MLTDSSSTVAMVSYRLATLLFLTSSLVVLAVGHIIGVSLATPPGLATGAEQYALVLGYLLWLPGLGFAIFGALKRWGFTDRPRDRLGILPVALFVSAPLVTLVPWPWCPRCPSGFGLFVYPTTYTIPWIWLPPTILVMLGLAVWLYPLTGRTGRLLVGLGLAWTCTLFLLTLLSVIRLGNGFYGTYEAFVLPGLSAIGYLLMTVASTR